MIEKVDFIESEISSLFNSSSLKYNSFKYILHKNKRTKKLSKNDLSLKAKYKQREFLIEEGSC